jgi:peptide/nickel transport system substrate-binding protein
VNPGAFLNAHVNPNEAMNPNEGKWGGTLTFSHRVDPKQYNDAYSYDVGAAYLQFMIYDPLVAVDATRNGIVPRIAERWEASDDLMTYTFYLRHNVTFHDGVKLTSADVKYTLETAIANKYNAFSALGEVSKILAPDDYTIKIILSKPDAAFVEGNFLSFRNWFGILPKRLYEGTDWAKNEYNLKPVGSGPFRFVEHVTGSYTKLAANEEYWAGRPYLDSIVQRYIPEASTAMAAFDAGETDYSISQIPFSETPRYMKQQGVTVGFVSTSVPSWLGINVKNPLSPQLRDPKVREAIAYAINRTELNKRAWFGLVDELHSFIDPNFFDWAYNSTAKLPDQDLKKAEELLDQAGLQRGTDGTRFEIHLAPFPIVGHPEMGIVIKDQLARVGVKVTIDSYDPATWYSKMGKGQFDTWVEQFDVSGDPSSLSSLVITNGTLNYQGYSNPKVDELFTKGQSVKNREVRKVSYQQIQEILREDLPLIPLISYKYSFIHNSRFHNLFYEKQNLGKVATWDFRTTWSSSGSVASPTDASKALKVAEQAINSSKAKGVDVTTAIQKLNAARESYKAGQYDDAMKLAKGSGESGATSGPTEGLYSPLLTVAISVVLVSAVAIAIFVVRKRRRSMKGSSG